MTVVYLGLGANLGDRGANIDEAIRRLRDEVRITAISSFFESAPMGYADQADFLNAVCEAETGLPPEQLLVLVKGIEAALGRKASFPNAPRPIDIDILLYGDLVLDRPGLTIPHPRMLERPFVLLPLAEIAPLVRHPIARRRVAQLAVALGSQGLRLYRHAFPRPLPVQGRGGKDSWTELAITVQPELVEPLMELFTKRGKAAVAIEETPTEETSEAWAGPVRAQWATLRAYLPGGAAGKRRRATIEAGLALLGMITPLPPLSVREVRAEEWETVLRGHFPLLRIGRRLVLQPLWQEYEPKAGEVVIRLDPGAAFGTGHHPTTRLCLEALEDLVRPGWSVLDVGTGSGVLALAAGLLGATSVLGVDTDALAARMARRNARANGLQGRVRIARSPPRPAGGPASFEEGQTAFDLVVANITAAVLTKLMPHLAAAAKPGGLLLLSGVLKEQMSELAEHALGHGLRLTETREEGDWTATVWRQG